MSRVTRIRLLLFLVVGALAVVNAGARYAGLTDLLFSRSYDVHVHLAASGGLFEHAEVTWRGVPVGRVVGMEFERDGLVATVRIDDEWRIPAQLRAEVHKRSAVGEQYLDLQPETDQGPFLEEGSVIATARTSTPVPDDQFIRAAHRLLTSVDPDDLATVVDESGRAFAGAGGDIGRIIDNARVIVETARGGLPDTDRLLTSGETVLRTQDSQAPLIASYVADLDRVSGVLADRRTNLRRILLDGSGASGELGALARGLTPELRLLLTQVLTLVGLTNGNLAKLEETLVAMPWALAAAQTPGRDGRAHFTFVGTTDPAPCQLGYLPPPLWRSPLDPTRSQVPDAIHCQESGAVPRGAQTVHPVP